MAETKKKANKMDGEISTKGIESHPEEMICTPLQPPWTDEELKALEALNEIWGDDEDGKYAQMNAQHE